MYKLLIVDDFLDEKDLKSLKEYTLNNQKRFTSAFYSKKHQDGSVELKYDSHSRKALMIHQEFEPYRSIFIDYVKGYSAQVYESIGFDLNKAEEIHCELTASHNDSFFGIHRDNYLNTYTQSKVTAIFYFHFHPKVFEGGELRIWLDSLVKDKYEDMNGLVEIAPFDNRLVIFDSNYLHEVKKIQLNTERFQDGRFAIVMRFYCPGFI